MSISFLRAILASLLCILILGCSAQPSTIAGISNGDRRNELSSWQLEENKSKLDEIRSRFSCIFDRDAPPAIMMLSYLRSNLRFEFTRIFKDQIEEDLKLTQVMITDFISPSYLEKYFVNTDFTVISDLYGRARNLELICITPDETGFSSYVMTYSPKSYAYAHINRFSISMEAERPYIIPIYKPSQLAPQQYEFYKSSEIANIPVAEFKVYETIFKQGQNSAP